MERARGIETKTGYDALNRPLVTTYTPAASPTPLCVPRASKRQSPPHSRVNPATRPIIHKPSRAR